jgi:hypothetical protein
MKAVQLKGAQGKWVIQLYEDNPWNPCGIAVYRVDGTTQYYDTEAEAIAIIAALQGLGEQGALDHYSKPLPADVLGDKPRRVKRG